MQLKLVGLNIMSNTKILAEHVRAAAKMWDQNPGYRGFRNGTTYEVLIGGKSYPPKAIASYAHKLAGNKDILHPRDFKGAWEGKWHKLLEDAGFKPRRKSERKPSKASERPTLPMESAGLNEKAEFAEGSQHYAEHIKRERNRKAVKLAKDQRWREKKTFACDVCQFDFAKVYGKRGAGYIEAHHTLPLSEMQPGHKTKITDFALVCSNCHRMLHTMKPLIDVQKLKKAIRTKAAK